MLCEKPLSISAADAAELVEIAKEEGWRNCTNHNLRYYPMVQHMRRMRETATWARSWWCRAPISQDWLLYDTDWNWRIVAKENGPPRAMADIGSH